VRRVPFRAIAGTCTLKLQSERMLTAEFRRRGAGLQFYLQNFSALHEMLQAKFLGPIIVSS